MIEQLLACLASDHPYTMSVLAAKLDVSEELLVHMLADLERAGYVTAMETGCAGQCGGCTSAGLCALLHGKRIWSLTARGRAAAS